MVENVRVAGHPREPDAPALVPQRLARRVHILAYCDKLLTPV